MDSPNYDKEKVEGLQVELKCLQKENEALGIMFETMSRKYNMLHQAYLHHESNKRPRLEVPCASKASQVFVKTDPRDKSLIVKDGFQWRKYGQKVTKNNPSPRAYFRCFMAPGCPVKKKVQRCLEDKSYVVATYEGQHNHHVVDSSTAAAGPSLSSSCRSGIFSPATSTIPYPILDSCNFRPTVTLDLTPSDSDDLQTPSVMHNNYSTSNKNNKIGIEDYVASLTKDPNFTLPLATAVARSIITEHPNLVNYHPYEL